MKATREEVGFTHTHTHIPPCVTARALIVLFVVPQMMKGEMYSKPNIPIMMGS